MTPPVIPQSSESKSGLPLRRGEGGRERWGGPLWSPAEVEGESPSHGEVFWRKSVRSDEDARHPQGAPPNSQPPLPLHLSKILQKTYLYKGSPALPNPPALFDSPSQYEPYEHGLAQRWWSLSPGDILPLSNGDTCQILFAGRPGSASGPDVRDAVLRFTTRKKSSSPTSTAISTTQSQIKKLTGDVEFHVRASDWYTHRHHSDPRYNNVILHVVLICDDTTYTQRQDGITVPLCSLYDLHHLDHPNHLAPLPHSRSGSRTTLWPCHSVIPFMSDSERGHLLRHAGLLRFEQKTHGFVEQLHKAQPHASLTTYDTCLIPALAEGLGYGRDRAIFRAAGLRLLGIPNEIPEPLGHTPDPSPLDARRLHILHSLVDQWRNDGAWETIRKIIMQPPSPTIFSSLRAIFTGLSFARTDILICNVVLPFSAAIALIENNAELAEHTRNLYLSYPALPSNSITRAVCRQLQLPYEPHNACQQQGLHYIYTQTCREKHCAQCSAGRHPL